MFSHIQKLLSRTRTVTDTLDDRDRAVVLLNCLSRELRQVVRGKVPSPVWKEFRARRKSFSAYTAEVELRVLTEFLEVRFSSPPAGTAEMLARRAHLVAALEGFLRTDSARAGELIATMLGYRPGPGKEVAQQLVARHASPFRFGEDITPRQKAAIVFMSIPPELSAELFSCLGPEVVQAVTLEITQLPSLTPCLRAQVAREFLGLAEKEAGDLGRRLEGLVAASPVRAAELLLRLWLEKNEK